MINTEDAQELLEAAREYGAAMLRVGEEPSSDALQAVSARWAIFEASIWSRV